MEQYRTMNEAYSQINSSESGMGIGYENFTGDSFGFQMGYETPRRNKCGRASCSGCGMC